MYVFGAILIGFLSAVLAGMFGVGGAGLSTPALRMFLGASPAIALGTPLPVTIPTAGSAALTYWRRGLVETRVAGMACVTGVVGAVGGAFITKYLNLHYLMILTGVFILYVAAMTLKRGISGDGPPSDLDEKPCEPHEAEDQVVAEGNEETRIGGGAWLVLGIGFTAGFFSGLLGLGGGVVLIPGFMYLLHMPIRRAFATSLAVIAVIAIPGTIVHSLLGHIDWTLVLYLVIGAIPGAWLGARLNLRTAERALYIAFGALLGIFGVLFIVGEIISMLR